MSLWTYFLNTQSAAAFAEENETVAARTMMAEADRIRLDHAARLTPLNLHFAAAALAEGGAWPAAVAMKDEADQLRVSEGKPSAWQRIFAAVAFAEAGEPEMARTFLDDDMIPASQDVQVQDRRLELFLQSYVRMAGAVAFAEAGDREHAMRLSRSKVGQILVFTDGGLLHRRMANYAIKLAEKTGMELVMVNGPSRTGHKQKGKAGADGMISLLDEARHCNIACRHYAAGNNPVKTVDKICTELGKVAFVLTEKDRQAEQVACGKVPVFTMALLDEALGQPTAA